MLLAALLLVPCALAISNKSPRHVAGSGAFASSAGGFASSSASSSAYGGSYGGSSKGGCSSCPPGPGQDLANVAFWWANPDSPFKAAQEYFRRCAEKGDCASVPGPFNFIGYENAGAPGKPVSTGHIDIANNPFLNGEYKGIAVSSCSGSACPGGKPHVTITDCKGAECKTVKHDGEPSDVANNPFFGFAGSGGFKSSHGAGSDIAHAVKGGAFAGGFAGSSFQHGSGFAASGCTGYTCPPSKEFTPPPYSGGSSTPASYQPGSYDSGKPGCHPGQPGCPSAPSGGGYPPSGSHGQEAPGCYPGKPGCGSQTPGGCYPGKPGCGSQTPGGYEHGKQSPGGYEPGKQSPGGYEPGKQSPGGYQPGQPTGGCYPGKPGCGPQTPGSYEPGKQSPGGYQPGKPTGDCYPGKPGCESQTPGSYEPGKQTPGGYEPSRPTGDCYPGKPGCGSQTPGAYEPGKQTPGGYEPGKQSPGGYQPGKPTGDCYPGKPGCGPQTPGGYEPGKQTPGGYQPGKPTGDCYPGKPGCGPQTPGGYEPGKQTPGGYQPGKPTGDCYPGKPGCGPQTPEGYEPSRPTGDCYPGKPGCGSQTPGAYEPGKQTPGGYEPSRPTGDCYPGKPGCGSQTPGAYEPGKQTPGGYEPGRPTGSYQPGKQTGQPIPTCYPGQPGCSQPSAQPEKPSSIPTCYPGQPGCSQPGGQPEKPSSIPTCYPGQPGCSQPGQPKKPSGIPTCYPGQPGCSRPESPKYEPQRPGCFPGEPGCDEYEPVKPSCYPGQPGCGLSSGSQTKPDQTGSKPCYPGQPGCPTVYTSGTTQFPGPLYESKPSFPDGGKYPGSSDGQLTLRCGGKGYFCVAKHLCNNGIINTNGEQIFHQRAQDQFCDVNAQVCCRLPDIPTYFHSSSSHSSAASSASSATSATSNTYFTSHGPTVASTIAGQYGKNHPGDAQTSATQQPGLIHVPPGKTYRLPGSPGNSPGLIHVVPDGPLVHVAPNGETEVPRPFTSGPNYVKTGPGAKPGFGVTPSAHESTFKDVRNELGVSSTVQGPAYLPPDSSPTPDTYTPDLRPPSIPGAPSDISPTVLRPDRPTAPQTPEGTNVRHDYLPPDLSYVLGDVTKPTQKPHVQDSSIININVIRPSTPAVNYPKYTPPEPDRRPDPAGNTETRVRPFSTTEYPFKGDLNTTPYPGCAAALKCVQAQFCTADGVISTSPVVLTKEQESNRVPLTECADPETGVIGKCCRDPTYKDPWPASQLGLYNPNDGFDNGQYKANGNDGKYRRPNPGVKGRPFQDPNQLGASSNSPSYARPNQVGAPSNPSGSYLRPNQGYPARAPEIPFDNRQNEEPPQVEAKPPVEYDLGKQPYSPSKSSETCGVRKPGGYPKGQSPIDVDFAEIPWQAMILRDSNRSLLCGGAIIRKDAVLTAASCVEGLESNDVLVKGGEWKLGIDEEPKPFQIIKVAVIVRHPGFDPETKRNDVALLVLSEKFRIDRNVDTICLPGPDVDVEASFKNSKCIATGWGKTILQLHLLNALMHSLDVGIVPAAQCQASLAQNHPGVAGLHNGECICGAPTQPNADVCDVDVGSALACDNGDGHYTLVGIYDWDTGCRTQAQIAGFWRVDVRWIDSQLRRPISDLKNAENAYRRLPHPGHVENNCHCQNGKK